MSEFWDPCQMAAGCKVLIIGERGSGKTTLLRDLLYKRRRLFKDGEALIGGRTRDYEVPYLPAHRVHLVADGPYQISMPSVWIGEEVGRQVLRSAEFGNMLAGPSEVYVTAQCLNCIPFDIRSQFDLLCISSMGHQFLCVDRQGQFYSYKAQKQTPDFVIAKL